MACAHDGPQHPQLPLSHKLLSLLHQRLHYACKATYGPDPKGQGVHMGATKDSTFMQLKHCFTTAPILTYPDNDCQFRLETDTSNFATGTVLSILKDEKWHPITFSSHAMSLEEWNYLVADKEMLLVIRSLEKWCHYLEGAHHEFEIWNDHVNLQWFMKRQDLNRHKVCWAQYLSRFAFKWTHKAGSTMGKADMLSAEKTTPSVLQKTTRA